jgi:hypothetical protein
MKKTLLGLLATAMLMTACQKEATAPTNEATLVPKCLEGEYISQGITGMFFVKVTNAKIGATWTPKSNCENLSTDGNYINVKGQTFENVIALNNGYKLFKDTYQDKKIFGGTKLYFTIDSANIGNTQACPSFGAYPPIQEEICTPYPAKEFMFCIKSISTTKCQ